ncbi:MAG: esterase family protein, partial [Planctomycetales bacterium]
MTNTARPALLGMFLVVAALPASAQWIKKPSEELIASSPGLIHESFPSESMKTTVGYSVILPPGYETGNRRFPVVYWLHGGGGNECSSLFTADAWRELYKRGEVQEVILVYPNGFRSGYMDHHDGKIMTESMIIRELIPRIDRRYRTIASRAGRAVHGFSMGASGSLKFA